MTYLGTPLTPDEYYRAHAGDYVNGQAEAVGPLLKALAVHLRPRVLDLGCGAGLATQALIGLGVTDIVGSDRSPEMVQRYTQETGKPGQVASFWDQQPSALTAVCVHALHLCPASRLWEVPWTLRTAGIQHLIVISPLKRAGNGLSLRELARVQVQTGPERKTVWGWVFGL